MPLLQAAGSASPTPQQATLPQASLRGLAMPSVTSTRSIHGRQRAGHTSAAPRSWFGSSYSRLSVRCRDPHRVPPLSNACLARTARCCVHAAGFTGQDAYCRRAVSRSASRFVDPFLTLFPRLQCHAEPTPPRPQPQGLRLRTFQAGTSTRSPFQRRPCTNEGRCHRPRRQACVPPSTGVTLRRPVPTFLLLLPPSSPHTHSLSLSPHPTSGPLKRPTGRSSVAASVRSAMPQRRPSVGVRAPRFLVCGAR